MRPCQPAAAATLLLICGCNATTESDMANAGSQPRGVAGQPGQAGHFEAASLLESSTPANGARLAASPDNLVLNFSVPVRLHEVTVHGSDGQTVPMMITAAGLVRSYSIPLPELEPGSYRVQWRATDEAGGAREGMFNFVIG